MKLSYPKEVIDLAITLPFRTSQVMAAYEIWNRDIVKTEEVLLYHCMTGRLVRPGMLESNRFKRSK